MNICVPSPKRNPWLWAAGYLFLMGFLVPTEAWSKELSSKKAYRLVDQLFDEKAKTREKAKAALIAAGDLSIAPALVETVFFSAVGRDDAVEVLQKLLGVSTGPVYKDWVAQIGAREDIVPKPGYLPFKARLHAKIDPNLAAFLDEKLPRTIRPEEIVWGGVKKDGIPALDHPRFIPAAEASYLTSEELVFGVAIDGDVRAYPHRIMDWHEMVNDTVAERPISISYCTLCGAGILFDTRRAGGGSFTFGSSGFLYRSNKLMYDHQTNTLWSNLTGEPVMGTLVGSGVELPVLPLTVTTWGAWLGEHPETKVLSLDTGYARDYRVGAAYGSYFASPETMFPVWKKPPEVPELATKDWVWVAVVAGRRKAYPIETLKQQPFLVDRVGEAEIVLLTDPISEAVRVFETQGRTLRREAGALFLEDGRPLVVRENGLRTKDSSVVLPRVPGHRTFWFSWGAFFPDAEYYRPEP